ncbi:hypothetical protein QBC39DRAFT_23150 [Podospora conica]|nr:hypothetical protein QBC39DRAFT_23150 [Schizothecium conicum]
MGKHAQPWSLFHAAAATTLIETNPNPAKPTLAAALPRNPQDPRPSLDSGTPGSPSTPKRSRYTPQDSVPQPLDHDQRAAHCQLRRPSTQGGGCELEGLDARWIELERHGNRIRLRLCVGPLNPISIGSSVSPTATTLSGLMETVGRESCHRIPGHNSTPPTHLGSQSLPRVFWQYSKPQHHAATTWREVKPGPSKQTPATVLSLDPQTGPCPFRCPGSPPTHLDTKAIMG